MSAHDVFATDPDLFERIAEQVESDTCQASMCQRPATVTLTFATGPERFCRFCTNDVLGR